MKTALKNKKIVITAVTILVLIIAAGLYWRFIYQNEYEKMINNYVDYAIEILTDNNNSFENSDFKVVEAKLISEAFPGPVDEFQASDGWCNAIIRIYWKTNTLNEESLQYFMLTHHETRGIEYVNIMEQRPEQITYNPVGEYRTSKIKYWDSDNESVLRLKKELESSLPSGSQVVSFNKDQIIYTLDIYNPYANDSILNEQNAYAYIFDSDTDFETMTYSAAMLKKKIYFPVSSPDSAIIEIDPSTDKQRAIYEFEEDLSMAWIYTLDKKLVTLYHYPLAENGMGYKIIIIDPETGQTKVAAHSTHNGISGNFIAGIDTGLGRIHALSGEISDGKPSTFHMHIFDINGNKLTSRTLNMNDILFEFFPDTYCLYSTDGALDFNEKTLQYIITDCSGTQRTNQPLSDIDPETNDTWERNRHRVKTRFEVARKSQN